MMSKFTVELDIDEVDSIVVQVLKVQYSNLEYDLERRKDGKETLGIFLSNKEEDIAEIRRHLAAIATVLSYNMSYKDFEVWKNGKDL
jgi:hypothetical protein